MNLLDLLLNEEKSFGKEMAEVLVFYVFPAMLALSVIWVIWVGIQLAKAKDEGARRQAKERFIKAFAGLFIIGCLYIIMGVINSTIEGPKGKSMFELINFYLTIFK